MGKRKPAKAEDEVKGGVQIENVVAAAPKKRRLAKRTNRGRVDAAAAVQAQHNGASPLGVLNDDCLQHVLSFMDGPEQLLQQRAVSRHWSSLASSDPLWRPHFLRLFGPQVFDAADYYRLHRLAVLLSLLSINKHAPKPGDEVRIGYAGKSCTITLARFCYAFLHGKERELAEELDLLSPPPACPDMKEKPKTKATTTTTTTKGKKALSKSKDEVIDDDEAPRKPRRFGWREFKEPALSLNVAGDFTPFAFFLSGPYGQKRYPFDSTYPCLDHHEAIFGSASDIQASYCFRTPEKGWAPGFFNASFSWYSHAAISTFHNPTRRQILVIKALEMEMVW